MKCVHLSKILQQCGKLEIMGMMKNELSSVVTEARFHSTGSMMVKKTVLLVQTSNSMMLLETRPTGLTAMTAQLFGLIR